MPFSEAGRSAMQKLVAAMAAEDTDLAEQLASRVWIATTASTAHERGVARVIEQAVTDRNVVKLTYRDRRGQSSARRVEAHGVLGGPRGWYLVGWCLERQDARTFRLDRIVSVERTSSRAAARDMTSLLPYADETTQPASRLVRGEEAQTKSRTAPALRQRPVASR
jgi:predicted DNA-binding transcriptional regulator YafY